MTRIAFTHDLRTERGVAYATIDADIDAEITAGGAVSITGVWIGSENILLTAEPLPLRIACAIASAAEDSEYVMNSLRDEAYARRMERAVVARERAA